MHMIIRTTMSEQQYLPDALKDSRFYEMTEIGYEKKMKEHLDKIKAEADSE